MNWAEDYSSVTGEDFGQVWRYEEKRTKVVRLKAEDSEPLVYSLESIKDWEAWITSNEYPELEERYTSPGMVLIPREWKCAHPIPSDGWLSLQQEQGPISTPSKKALTLTSLAEHTPAIPLSKGQRSVRTLPFTEETFRIVAEKFYVHHSISAVVSRADIPTFSSTEVDMKGPDGATHHARVYNCRTTNAWELDMALTATHFPQSGLTYAILFGCPLSIEVEVIRRFSKIMTEASHPLVLPGIFAELERNRHIAVVEQMIDRLESRIYELDLAHSSSAPQMAEMRAQMHRDKREDYLDTSYLRNGLISWRNQLHKMVKHGHNLEFRQFTVSGQEESKPLKILPGHEGVYRLDFEPEIFSGQHLHRTSRKIIDRLESIIEEYDGKIRDCTMHLDGMAMATQWAQGETNVDIALATSRDSKHMRSIALVTMVFLPGTFFAAVFSMSFFTWFEDDGASAAHVSSYVWVYILFTVVSTVLTVGSWYYFNIWRQRRSPQKDEEMPMNVLS